jgi:hypothetical protein
LAIDFDLYLTDDSRHNSAIEVAMGNEERSLVVAQDSFMGFGPGRVPPYR